MFRPLVSTWQFDDAVPVVHQSMNGRNVTIDHGEYAPWILARSPDVEPWITVESCLADADFEGMRDELQALRGWCADQPGEAPT